MAISTRRTISGLALSLVASVALTSTVMPAAEAQTWSHADPDGDVSYSASDNTNITSAPGDARTDIVGFRVTHGPRVLVIKLTLRALPPWNRSLATDIRTPSRHYRTMSDPSGTRVFRMGTRGGCTVPRDTLDSARLQLRLAIPRSCLGRPRWVRVGAVLITERRVDGALRIYSDDALSSDAPRYPLSLSPRVPVG